MGLDLDDIKRFLKVLDLSENKLPTLTEYKAAYHEKFKLHPDLAGGDSEAFKSVTEAATEVFKFITKNQAYQTRREKLNDQGLLKTFESSNDVKYSHGNVVFKIEAGSADRWIECLRKKMGDRDPTPLSNGSGVQLKIADFKIPLVSCFTKTNYGSLSVTVWPSPSDGQPKVCVQGTMHLAFVTFILPAVIKDVNTAMKGIQYSPEDESESDEENTDNDAKKSENDVINQTIKRVECEVLNVQDIVSNKVDLALSALASREPDNELNKRIDSLETILKSNQDQFVALNKSIDQLRSEISSLNPAQVDLAKLTTAVSGDPKIVELSANVSTLMSVVAKGPDVETIKQQVDGMSNILKEMNTTNTRVDTNLKEVSDMLSKSSTQSTQEMQQLRKNSDESLIMFSAMKSSLETLVRNNPCPAQPLPSTSSLPSTQNTAQDDPSTQKRKGLFFTSSIALDTDVQRFKDELNCDIKKIPTNSIENHPESKDSDAYLQCMVNKHIQGKSDYNFVIIATGTEDITYLDTVNEEVTTLYKKVEEQSKLLCEVAEGIIAECGVDVFVVDRPPRYDPVSSDPTGMMYKLSKYANSVLATTICATPRLFLVEQASLARTSGRARADMFQSDGIHLTAKGLYHHNTNIMEAIKECYGDINLMVKPPPSDNKKRGGGSSDSRGYRRGQDSDLRGQDRRDQPGRDQGDGYHARPYQQRGGDQWGYQPGPPPGNNRGWGGGYNRDNRDRGGFWDYNSQRGYGGGYSKPWGGKRY